MRVDPATPRSTDRFGNVFGPGLPYARGRVVTRTEDDLRKLEQAQLDQEPELMTPCW